MFRLKTPTLREDFSGYDGAAMIEHLPEQAPRPYGIIYLATNTSNGKGYVGQTVQALKARVKGHRQDANTRRGKSCFHSAIRKHGVESFTWQVLMACDSRDDLNVTEQAYIATMKTKAPGGYNLTNGGYGHSGFSPSAETKQKISRGNKGMNCSAETRQKMSEAQMGNTKCKGNVLSAEHRQKLSEANKGKVHSAEARRKLSKANTGHVASAQTKQKISEAGKGRVCSVETRKRMSEARKGRIHSAETRQKISEANTGKSHSAETRRKLSEANIGRVASAETRERMSESMKRRWKSIR